MNAQRIVVWSGAFLAIVAVVGVVSTGRRAQRFSRSEESRRFVADGLQADASSPFVLQGELIGGDAVWRRVRGPVLGDVIGTIPGLPPFEGAACRMEYSENEIVTQQGTLAVNLWGVRCEPNDAAAAAAGAHVTNGLYSIQGGPRAFQDIIGGTGGIQVDARSDGSVLLRIAGSIQRLGDAYSPF